MRARLGAVVALGVLLGVAALLGPSAGAESSPSAYASRLVSLINDARAQHGLKALTVTSGTSTVAASWTNHLNQQRALSHNPDLGHQLESHGSPDWTAYSENVGDGPTSSADTLFQAYMNSAEHRDNILGSAYRYLGVGVVFDGSTAWNTLDFVDQYASSSGSASGSSPSRPRTTTTHTAPKATTSPARPPQHHVSVVRQSSVRAVAPPKPSRHTQVRAVASKAPVAPVARAVAPVALADAAPAPARLVATVARPLPLPSNGRDTAPFVAAAAAILLVVATRYVIEVFARGAVTVMPAAR